MILIALYFRGDQTIQDACNDVCFKVGNNIIAIK